MMRSGFIPTRNGIVAKFSPEERTFMADILVLLANLGRGGEDPAADRLSVPVYLDDPDANSEWWRLMGEELSDARRSDRRTFGHAMESREVETLLTQEEASAFLRVVNEGRLALAARLGIEVEDDYESVSEEGRAALEYLGWVVEDLTDALSSYL